MAKLTVSTNDYATLDRVLGEKSERKIGHNTYIRRSDVDNGIAVVLHSTAIVLVLDDDSVYLNSGGYRTVTTKERINQFLPPGVTLFQKAGEWYIRFRSGDVQDFTDGVRVDAFGVIG